MPGTENEMAPTRPEPARLAVPVSPGAPVTVKVALLSFAVVGEKRNTMVQVPIGASGAVQLFICTLNWVALAAPSSGITIPVVLDPVLVTVIVRSAVAPMPNEPKFTKAGLSSRPVLAAVQVRP